MFPRFIMACINNLLPKEVYTDKPVFIKGLDKQVFARLNTSAKIAAIGDNQENPIPVEPTPSTIPKPKKAPTKRKASTSTTTKPKKPKKAIQEDEIPESVNAPTEHQSAPEKSSQEAQVSQPSPSQ